MAHGGLLATVPTPGFFHLDLFIKDAKDASQRCDEIKARLDLEKGPMESAMSNLLSVYTFYKQRDHGDALDFLEDLTKIDQNNLNAIANKQFIYGQLMRTEEETACRDKLQELLAEKSDKATARNARCFAEQGYALAFIRDDSKDMISKIRQAINLFRAAQGLVRNVGTDVVSEEERLVWKYYLGTTYWRLDDIHIHAEHKATSSHDDRGEGLLQSQILLIDVTKLDPSWEHSGFYIARAWGLLGALEYKCRKKCVRYRTPEYLVSQISQTQGPGLEWGCYKKALKINPTDNEVYRRFGQSYGREQLYENARQMLHKSIDIMPEKTRNWFAYFCRSNVNLKEYDQLARLSRSRRELSPPDKQLLQQAKQDAIASCEGATTQFNTYFLGKVCHRLAIHPVTNELEDIDELQNALDNFAQALQLEDGYTDHKTHAARAWSLEVAGEHEKAAESYKRAVETDEPTFCGNFLGVLKSFMALHASADHHMYREHYIAEL
ncbi:TTC22 [Branchiostoma lanceolatum]|uniref:TTC22 protein n=1 Tax=Branchiostoma lanceolatum TaxID=7740 RepID=A0A8J9ZU38_BRALA|nr:TTC22 [Branchiostoma lanceolatum]